MPLYSPTANITVQFVHHNAKESGWFYWDLFFSSPCLFTASCQTESVAFCCMYILSLTVIWLCMSMNIKKYSWTSWILISVLILASNDYQKEIIMISRILFTDFYSVHQCIFTHPITFKLTHCSSPAKVTKGGHPFLSKRIKTHNVSNDQPLEGY